MSSLILLRPWWLAALLVALGLSLLLRRTGRSAGGWEQVMSPAMLKAMRRLGHLNPGGARSGLAALAAACLLVIGLSGPAVPRADAPLIAGTGSILIAIDLSPSVSEGPALADAKAAAASVLSAADGRPVGLILYAGEAYAIAAPTADPAVLESDIAVLGPDTMPAGGSRPAAALALARQMLTGARPADLVLVSDGGGIDAQATTEAGRLRAEGIGLLVLTLDAAAGGPVDRDALVALSDAAAPARSPDRVVDRLAAAGTRDRDEAFTALHVHDLGPFVAALALVPMLALFRRRA